MDVRTLGKVKFVISILEVGCGLDASKKPSCRQDTFLIISKSCMMYFHRIDLHETVPDASETAVADFSSARMPPRASRRIAIQQVQHDVEAEAAEEQRGRLTSRRSAFSPEECSAGFEWVGV